MFSVKSVSPHPLYRWRYQFAGCVLLAAVLPYAIRYLTLPSNAFLLPLHTTFVGSVIAIFLGTWLFRSFTTYPGAEASSYIIPAFSITYGGLALVLIVGRLDYNMTVFLSGFVLSLFFFYWLVGTLRKRQSLRIAVIPAGSQYPLPNTVGVNWVFAYSPSETLTGYDAVTTDLRQDLPDEWDRRLTDLALAGVPVYHVKHLVESLTGRVQLEHLSENSFGSLSPVSAYMSVKHMIDWIVALVLGVLLLPALLVVAAMIKLSSPGPALFRQKRVGYQGRPFLVYKFRSMRVAAPNEGNGDARTSSITQPGDVRIFPLGRFLRKSRIDELPQIINVLRGEMSWIGPRPEAIALSEWYESEIPFYRYRHIIRPGIAGWAQVSQGHVADVQDVTSKLHYDFYYIKNYSPWIDMLIIMRTIRTMISGFGAK